MEGSGEHVRNWAAMQAMICAVHVGGVNGGDRNIRPQ
jgi:hypothetical protein